MTGFGRAEAEQNGKKITVEIKTVNHRFLDINIRMPRTMGFAEEGIRKSIKSNLERGRVDVFINYTSLGGESKSAQADTGLIRSYVDAARQASKECSLNDDLALSHILRIPEAIIISEEQEDEKELSKIMQTALKEALKKLVDMREREGTHLEKNIKSYLSELAKITKLIDSKKDYVSKEYSDKLKQRLSDLLDGAEIDETRFNSEIAYIADKADITEEIVRLNTHIKQFSDISSKKTAVGRKLDFVVQEMNRELNTIGSKTSDISITNAVIEGKSIVEKIREQVQNIE